MDALPEATRQRLLTAAVDALTASLACGPDTSRSQAHSLASAAAEAVTDAVVRGQHIHTLIAAHARCTGLTVTRYISDPRAHSRALAVERNAANNYMNLVLEAQRSDARQRVGAEGYGAVTAIARDHLVTRKTLYSWLGDRAAAKADRDAYYTAFAEQATQLNTRALAMGWYRLTLGGGHGVTAQEAARWANAGFLPGEALDHIKAGRTPEEIVAREDRRNHA